MRRFFFADVIQFQRDQTDRAPVSRNAMRRRPGGERRFIGCAVSSGPCRFL